MILISIPIILYLLAVTCLLYFMKSRKNQSSLICAVSASSVATIAHGILLSHQIMGDQSVNIGALKSLSLTAFIMMVIIIPKIKSLPSTAFALTIFATLSITLSLFQSQHAVDLSSLPLGIHVVISIVAYAILILAAVQSILIILQDRALKMHNASFILRNLPPILRMEQWLFQLVVIGFILLTLSLITSFFFIDQWFVKSAIHKTILTIGAWILFGSILIAHYRYQIRGKRAAYFVIVAALILLLAVTGTRLIQENIFNRT